MQLYLRLAWRNVWRHKRRTVIVVGAMAFSLALMMMYDGLINGFNNAIYGNAIRVMGGNIQIHASGYRENFESNPLLPLPDDAAVLHAALAQPGVTSAARRIQTGGMVANREGAFSLSIIGVEPEVEARTNLIAENVVEGRWLTAEDGDAVVIGRGLADEMQLKIGDRLTLVGRDANKQNRQRSMTVVGVYDLGMASLEKNALYISLAEAQTLYGLNGKVSEIQVNIENLGGEAAVVEKLAPLLPGCEVETWEENYPELKTTISRKTSVMNVFGVVIIGIAGVGILNLLLMAVYERTREIGLLGAMGVKPRQIAMLFLLEGALIGLTGAALGAGLGLLFNFIFGQFGFDYSSYSDIADYMALISGKVYPTLGLEQLPARALSVVVISILAAWLPAQEASRREPAEALHYV